MFTSNITLVSKFFRCPINAPNLYQSLISLIKPILKYIYLYRRCINSYKNTDLYNKVWWTFFFVYCSVSSLQKAIQYTTLQRLGFCFLSLIQTHLHTLVIPLYSSTDTCPAMPVGIWMKPNFSSQTMSRKTKSTDPGYKCVYVYVWCHSIRQQQHLHIENTRIHLKKYTPTLLYLPPVNPYSHVFPLTLKHEITSQRLLCKRGLINCQLN